jgi:hypothetical protein
VGEIAMLVLNIRPPSATATADRPVLADTNRLAQAGSPGVHQRCAELLSKFEDGIVLQRLTRQAVRADAPLIIGRAQQVGHDLLDGSRALGEFRVELADALSDAPPTPVAEHDVRVVSEAEILEDPLSGVTVTVRDGDHDVLLSEQGDGIRALSVLTLLGMSQRTARIVAIDEPEIYLHPTAQRSVAKTLRTAGGIHDHPILKREGRIQEPVRPQRDYVRFEVAAPNDLWQMDFKGDFSLAAGGAAERPMAMKLFERIAGIGVKDT